MVQLVSKEIMKTLIILLLMCSTASAFTINTGRGVIEVNSGDVLKPNMLVGSEIDCEGESNITFKGWNFSQKTPHTRVFKNCKNIKIIGGNLSNVRIPKSFRVKGALTIHQRKYKSLGVRYKEIQGGDGKTRTYRLDRVEVDMIEDEYPNVTPEARAYLEQHFIANDKEIIGSYIKAVLINTEDTPNDKKIVADVTRR